MKTYLRHDGWIGTWNELSNVLRTFHCDQDAEGKFLVAGNITSFMGAGEEFTVEENATYFVDSKPHSLILALYATSYGTKIKVI